MLQPRTLLILGVLSLGLAAPVDAATLVAHYAFENNSDDSSGNGFDAVTDSGTITYAGDGAIGSAASFDGSSSLLVSDAPALDFVGSTEGHTIALWYRTASAPTSTLQLLGKNANAVHRSYAVQWTDTPNRVQGWFQQPPGGFAPDYTYVNSPPADGQWHHVAVRYDRTTGLYTSWLDGVQVGTTNAGAGLDVNDSPADLNIGSFLGGSAFWIGDMDEIRLYDGALTDSEIQSLAVSASVPEPSVLGLLVIGALAVVGSGLRRQR